MLFFQSMLRASICSSARIFLIVCPVLAAAQSSPHARTTQQIAGDARIVHALDRLTFGPRPGDFAAVKAMGLEAWINQQLHPETIDDSALQTELQMYPAMHMSVEELLQQIPPPPVIRQVMMGRRTLPDDASIQAVYQTQIAQYQLRQDALAAQQNAQNATATASAPASNEATEHDALAQQQGKRVQPTDPGLDDKKQQILADLQATSIANLPPNERMSKLLAMQPVERISFNRDLTLEDRLAFVEGLTPQQSQLFSSMFAPVQTVASQLLQTKMLYVTTSNRQLQEVMTDFWLNHFNVDIRKNAVMPYYLTEYESKALRPNALGNFEDLLVATARSRAMLVYLDNTSNVGPHSIAAMRAQRADSRQADAQQVGTGAAGTPRKRAPPGLNENYARELMELHTLGVNGGYTQQDVIEVAKVFSGWTIDRPLQGGGFIFNANRHEPGTKVVLGHIINEHGEAEGLEVLHILANSPATAHHISEELAQRFVSDNPPPALVNRMAQTFLATHGDIRSVLQTLFFSPEFWSVQTLNAKVKTPLAYVASAVRASKADVHYPIALAFAVARLGMPLYACQPPTGYSVQNGAWVGAGSLVERMNFALAFADNRLPGVVNHWDALLGPDATALPTSRKTFMLEQDLLHGDISAQTKDAVLKGLVDAPAQQPHSFPLGGGMARGYIVPTNEPATTSSSVGENHSLSNPRRQPLPRDSQAAQAAGLLIGSPDFQSY